MYFNGYILWFVNYISIKLFKRQYDTMAPESTAQEACTKTKLVPVAYIAMVPLNHPLLFLLHFPKSIFFPVNIQKIEIRTLPGAALICAPALPRGSTLSPVRGSGGLLIQVPEKQNERWYIKGLCYKIGNDCGFISTIRIMELQTKTSKFFI